MADSQERSNKINSSQDMAEAFMLLNTPATVSEEVQELRSIARDKKARPADRINAIKTIWDYAMSKPKQSVDLTTKGNALSSIDLGGLNEEKLQQLETIAKSLGDTAGN